MPATLVYSIACCFFIGSSSTDVKKTTNATDSADVIDLSSKEKRPTVPTTASVKNEVKYSVVLNKINSDDEATKQLETSVKNSKLSNDSLFLVNEKPDAPVSPQLNTKAAPVKEVPVVPPKQIAKTINIKKSKRKVSSDDDDDYVVSDEDDNDVDWETQYAKNSRSRRFVK